jgi:nickel transport protein
MNYRELSPDWFVTTKKRNMYLFLASFWILLSCFFPLSQAEAHKVNIFAYAQEGKVYAEGYFVDGSKCKNSVIEVFDSKTGEKLLDGKTDDNGQMSFAIPRVTSMKLVLRAGEGHQGEYILKEDEIKSAMPVVKKQAEKQAGQKKKEVPEQQQTISEQTEVRKMASSVSAEDLEAVVGKVVDNKLQPVLKILLELQEKGGKPGLTEIFGGIGYIIGILGVIAYFKGRGTNR